MTSGARLRQTAAMTSSEGTGTPVQHSVLPGDNPQAYIPGDRRRALSRGESLPEVSHGAALFVDISGFTPLTEALAAELGGRRGAEELTATLDRVFAALLERLHAWRGSVVYFSGDAVTAWIDGDDGVRATACALEMQQVMRRVGILQTPGGAEVTLSVKVAVAVGSAHRFVVGDPSVQLIDVLAGRLMDSLAAAEQQSVAGDVVIDAGTLASLGDRVVLLATRTGEYGEVGVVDTLRVPPGDPGPEPPLPRLSPDVVREWLLPPVWERIAAGRGEFLAELRPAVPVFVQLGGLDFENDPESPAVLDRFVTTAQRVLDEQGGSVLQLTIGDKGVYLYAVFGSPIAHEDDAARACEGALRLKEAVADLPVTDLSIGIATGRLRSGTYGHRERRTFCCLGDAVNLAARLMARAPSWEIWVHGEVAAATETAFAWDDLDPITVKGKRQPVEVRALRGHGHAGGHHAHEHVQALGAMVGRDDELAGLRAVWDRVERGTGHVAVVQAEAGVGKSRLVGELVDRLVADGVPIAWSEATRVTTGSTYLAWRSVWADLLGLDLEEADASDVVAAVADLAPLLVARAPLLGSVLGVAVPDSSLTGALEGEARKTSLEDLLGRLLTERAARGPIAVVLEDCHWLDDLSRDLLAALARVVRTVPVLLLLTSRPDGTPLAGLPVGRGPHVSDVELGALDPAAAEELATTRYRVLAGHDPLPTLLFTVVGRAEGNPFYLVQLVDYVLAHAATPGGRPDPDALDLPDSLHTLVLSRIDAQPEGPRRAVKVASVIGRTFGSRLVAGAYPDLGPADAVHGDLVTMAGTRLIDLEDAHERQFAFGHAVTRDVAYDSLPFGIRTLLHGRVAQALEVEPEGPVRHLDLLAFHYARSDDLPKRRHYLLAAAEAARLAYANTAAVEYLEQVLSQIEPTDLSGILLKLSDAKERSGDWAGADEAARQALQAALDAGNTADHARALVVHAELSQKQGRYVEAEELLQAAELEFASIDDDAGRGRVLHLRGTLASQQGDHAAARAAYEASLVVRRQLGDEIGITAMLANLALVAEDEGDLAGAVRLGLDALERRRGLGDVRGVSISLMNIGMLALGRADLLAARERFAEAEQLAAEVGDPWLVAVGRHNLGNVTRDLGDLDAASEHLGHALTSYAEHDDRWSLAQVFEDVALWLVAAGPDGDEAAVRLLSAAEGLREEIGAPRFPPTEAALQAALEPARSRTASALLEAAELAGRTDSLDGSVARAGELLASARV